MFLEVFFHFFGCRLSDNTNTVVVDRNLLITLAILVFGCEYHDFLNKFVYQFGCEGVGTGNLFCFVDKPLQAFGFDFCIFKLIFQSRDTVFQLDVYKRQEGDTLIAPLSEIVHREMYSRFSKRPTRIVTAELGNDAGIIGAAALGLQYC